MKRFANPILSIAAPLLIIVGTLGLFQRDGSEQLPCFPALFVGTGLIISGALYRRNRRRKLLLAIRNNNNIEN